MALAVVEVVVRDLLDELLVRWEAGEPVGLATVVDTWRSAPRPAGAMMFTAVDGTVVGSVSGGCVEADAYELCRSVIESGIPMRQRYGVSDDDAYAAGLTCGGVIDLFVERVDQAGFAEFGEVVAAIRAGVPVAVATCVSGPPDRLGRRLVVFADGRRATLGSARFDDAVTDDARGLLATGRSATIHYGHDGERRGDDVAVFVASYAPRPKMLVFGAIDFAAAVAKVGSFLGYHVTVCDARAVFVTAKRFPDADDVIIDWPHRYLSAALRRGELDSRTVVCVLTHDPKFDVPVLDIALRQPFAYVGAMGSRRTHDDRIARLREAGLTDGQLARLASPIGLDLGARTAEETAISIAAEIIAVRWGGHGARLSHVDGRIHK